MATTPTITAWDENGNPVQRTKPTVTAWDEKGNPISSGGGTPIQDTSTISAPKPRSLLGRAEDWWTNKPAYGGTLDRPGTSPREKFRAAEQGAAVASLPLLGGGLATAPAATLLGLGGGMAGGYAGKKAGSYIGEKVGAPEIGEDVGGLTGSLLGGMAGSKSSALAKRALVDATGRPTPMSRLLLGSDRARALGELADPELAASRSALQARFDALRAGQTAPGPWRPGPPRMPPSEPDPVLQAVREGRAAKLPTRMPRPALENPPSPPNPFQGMTSSRGPLGNAPLSTEPLQGRPSLFQPNVQMVERFSSPEAPQPSRIIQPGTPEAQAPHVEGSYWSFKEPQLRQAVLGGDRDAAIVYKQRFGELPSGAGYLTDVGQGPNRGLYRSTKP